MIETRRQLVSAIKKNGLSGIKISGVGRNVEVEIDNDSDYEAFINIIPWSGYTTGYGSRILRPFYKDRGDWNDKSSAWHY